MKTAWFIYGVDADGKPIPGTRWGGFASLKEALAAVVEPNHWHFAEEAVEADA